MSVPLVALVSSTWFVAPLLIRPLKAPEPIVTVMSEVPELVKRPPPPAPSLSESNVCDEPVRFSVAPWARVTDELGEKLPPTAGPGNACV